MAKVEKTPFNRVPTAWARDPEIGGFIRNLLNVINQIATRTGGDVDLFDSLDGDIDSLDSRVTELESGSIDLSDEIPIIGLSVAATRAHLGAINTDPRPDHLLSRIAALESENSALKSQLFITRSNLSAINQKLAELETLINLR